MWFIFALVTSLCWGAADLFYKLGSEKKERSSALRIVICVGLVMGLQAFYLLIFGNTDFVFRDIIVYLPVSAMYILSMFCGYVGLRYIELSVSSPIQNSSGALTAILLVIFFGSSLSALGASAIALITVGVVLLAAFEPKQSIPLASSDSKYRFGVAAILMPVLYCVIDALGTFADGVYLDELEILSEDSALIAYELTFFFCGLLAFLWLAAVKKERFTFRGERSRVCAAVLETAGQYFYVYAMAENAVVAAPLVASYSIFSVLLSRIFLREKLEKKQYVAVAMALVGIALLGLADEL